MKKITSAVCLILLVSSSALAATPKVIYGQDDRKEVSEYPNRNIQKLANSVAGRVSDYSLYTSRISGFSDYSRTTLDEAINACPGERFADQPVLMSCTGFLVGDDLLVTAGHCMRSYSDCASNQWVFGFTAGKSLISNNDIYQCAGIVAKEEVSIPLLGTTDYAIIKLDRKVKGRTPLKFRTKGRVKNGTEVLVIGHPMGLPLKIADNATVSGSFGKTFKTDLDTYGGNSGSPVLDANTGLVEGILVQGSQDLSYGSCTSSRMDDGANEIVYKITRLKALQKLAEDGKL